MPCYYKYTPASALLELSVCYLVYLLIPPAIQIRLFCACDACSLHAASTKEDVNAAAAAAHTHMLTERNTWASYHAAVDELKPTTQNLIARIEHTFADDVAAKDEMTQMLKMAVKTHRSWIQVSLRDLG